MNMLSTKDFYTGLLRTFCLCLVTLHLTSSLSFNTCPPTETAIAPNHSPKVSVVWAPPQISGDDTNIALSHDHNPGDQFPIGNTTVTYTALNFTGTAVLDTAICTFVVRVLDITPPLILQCPYPITLGLPHGQSNTSIVWASPTAIDNSGTVNLTSSHQPGDVFSVGVTEVSYFARDPSGNVADCIFNISLHTMNTSITDITDNVEGSTTNLTMTTRFTLSGITKTSAKQTSPESATVSSSGPFKDLSPMWKGKIGSFPIKKPVDAVLHSSSNAKGTDSDDAKPHSRYKSPTLNNVDLFVRRNGRVVEIACITFISLVLVAVILVGAFYNKTITQALRLRHERRRTPFPSTSWEQCPQMEGMNDPLISKEYSDLPSTPRTSGSQDRPLLQPGEVLPLLLGGSGKKGKQK